MHAKITGFGGVFLKVKDVEATKKWYQEHLGFEWDEYGTTFNPKDPINGNGLLAFSFFDQKSEYFAPSKKEYMLNFRVQNLESLLKNLKSKDIHILGEIQKFEYGKFAHILDLNQVKIELWEPVDKEFEKAVGASMPKT